MLVNSLCEMLLQKPFTIEHGHALLSRHNWLSFFEAKDAAWPLLAYFHVTSMPCPPLAEEDESRGGWPRAR